MVRRKSPLPASFRDENWSSAIKKNRLFVYRRGDLMPSYTFEKREASRYWVGYNRTFQSVAEVLVWVRDQNPGSIQR